jgi:hypothetical protein
LIAAGWHNTVISPDSVTQAGTKDRDLDGANDAGENLQRIKDHNFTADKLKNNAGLPRFSKDLPDDVSTFHESASIGAECSVPQRQTERP